ncbi:CopG family transcriptional regulator [Nostoc sp. CCCryo 231-06]|nr:CopG family transcriptional regulator [Nostoc sp. CCCryo 231-06]
MSKPEIFITFRVTQQEKDLLKLYCEQEARNQTEVLRELIRSLNRRIKSRASSTGL